MYAGAIYDAIYLYAIALNETLAAGGSKKDGRAIVQRMLNREFEGKELFLLPYMGYIGMCRCEGYGFQAVYSRIGYINQSVWV